MKATCLNCGFENEITLINVDELGSHVQCTECKGSFDVDAAELVANLKLVQEAPLPERGITISHRGKLDRIGVVGHGIHGLHEPILHKGEIGIVGHNAIGKSSMTTEHMLAAAREKGFNVVHINSEQDSFMRDRFLETQFHNYIYGSYEDKLLKIMELNPYANATEPKAAKDYLLENDINSFAKLEVEYNLIQIKKSKLPSQVRSMIVIAYEAVTLPKK